MKKKIGTITINPSIESLIIGAEFGYMCCEKGYNLERTLQELRKAALPVSPVPPRVDIAVDAPAPRKRRKMSAAARKKISEAMKRSHAERRKAAKKQ
jgi:lysophospholipase L1-like esterase